jgi:hypothetical protein
MKALLMLILVAALVAGCDLTATQVKRTGPTVDGKVPVAITFEDGSVLNTTVQEKSGPITVNVPGTDATVTISLDGTAAPDESLGWEDAAGGAVGAVTGNPMLALLAAQVLRLVGGAVRRKVVPVAEPAP